MLNNYDMSKISEVSGVSEVFEVEDLLERRNIPKVTKCLAQLSKLVSSNKENK